MLQSLKSKTNHFFYNSSRQFKLYSIVLFLLILLLNSCRSQMSVEEAKMVTVSIGKKTFSPPPRHTNDILKIFEETESNGLSKSSKMVEQAKAKPPKTVDAGKLSQFYFKRGRAARNIGNYVQSRNDLLSALDYAKKTNKKVNKITRELSTVEIEIGNFENAKQYAQQSLKIKKSMTSYEVLTYIHCEIGELEALEATSKAGIAFARSKRWEEGWKLWPESSEAFIRARYLEAFGKYAEAEQHIRKRRNTLIGMGDPHPQLSTITTMWLARNLVSQGRLVEAEMEARNALKKSIGLTGKRSTLTGKAIGNLSRVILAQNRYQEAEKLVRLAVQTLEDSGISMDAPLLAFNRIVLCNALTEQSNFSAAIEQFDMARLHMKKNRYLYEKHFTRRPNLLLCLLKTRRIQEAENNIQRAYKSNLTFFGRKHYLTAEALGFRGIVHAMKEDYNKAFEDFSKAVPVLIEEKDLFRGMTNHRQRFKFIIEAYMDFLRKIHFLKLDKKYGINVLEETFKLSDTVRGQSVSSALGAVSARIASNKDPELKKLVRKDQDALMEISVVERRLSNAISLPEEKHDTKFIVDLKARIIQLRTAHQTLRSEIEKRFPRYSDFIYVSTVTPSQVQSYLNPGESLISIYTEGNYTFVWALPAKGKIVSAIIDMDQEYIRKAVTTLRKAFDPKSFTLGGIPEFDIDLAHELYARLLKPVEKGWAHNRDIIIVADGDLGQLPFSILPTAFSGQMIDNAPLFSKYRQIPWLIRKISITRQPSVYSFVNLRKIPTGNPDRKPFLGFGDPIFTPEQLEKMSNNAKQESTTITGRGKHITVRGIRVTDYGKLDSLSHTSLHLNDLNRLPDTAEEIEAIANAIGAELGKDLFLGKDASEENVKRKKLSDRKVIVFATHALIPGDLDGLDQSALALSAPEVTGGNENGLLTVGEILTLKLNADWIVLSACNTGAAAGAGAEAVSGLGRAFFYAGTRAILVSMWPVETSSAKELTTELFNFQKEDQSLSRARALQKSILELIDNQVLKEALTGKVIASYAHPFFWAPFIIVGDGGS